MLGIILSGLIIPLACSDNNNNPTKPQVPSISVTPTGTITPIVPTFTKTPTVTGTVNTPTVTPTLTNTPLVTQTPAPPFLGNYVTSAAPNAMYYDGSILYVAEGEVRAGGDVTMFECYQVSGGGNLTGACGGWVDPQVDGNQLAYGIPTPGLTPPWQPSLITATMPQGLAVTKGWVATLDSSPSGAATLYEGQGGFQGLFTCITTNYGGAPLNAPRAMVGDSLGNIYIADTGNAYVDTFGVGVECLIDNLEADWLHRWNGASSSMPFKQPVALAVDAQNDIWVGDSGYSPSLIEVYTSGGATFGVQGINPAGFFKTVPNCIINGLAVDQSASCSGVPGPCVYVSDTANGGQVEVYTSLGNLVRVWGDPHGPHEFLPFNPASIALIGNPPTIFIVGDTNNDILNVFGP